jgi:pyridoxal phosphate enzyme (YggS family)
MTAAITANLAAVRAQITTAARQAGRAPDAITLVAVSKTQSIAAIVAAYAVGQRDFGENRLEELWPKVHEARRRGLDDIRWHLIGTIQSRKTGEAVGPFALIHSVDRTKIAARLSRGAVAAGQVMDILLEINISGEASKHGFMPATILAEADAVLALPGVRVRGLMTMAPFGDDAEATRPCFRELRSLRDRLTVQHPDADWHHLSMGMSNDFAVAIAEGATLVRVGTAIFGERG